MGTNVMYVHGYSEFYLNRKWVKLTPSFDPKTALKGKFLPMVEFDGENDAIFPKFDNEGHQFGEYLTDRDVHADLPLEAIEKIFEENYEWYVLYKTGNNLEQIRERTLTHKK